MPPSAIFYNDTLLPYAQNHKVIWSGMPKPFLPLKFIGSTSPEDSSDEVCLFPYSNDIEMNNLFFSSELPGIIMGKSRRL
jgi:hypothetical protein